MKLGWCLRPGCKTDQNGHDETSAPGHDRDPEVLRHGGRKVRNRSAKPTAFVFGYCETVRRGGRESSRQQPEECPVPGGAFPEHAQKEGGEQRCVHEPED